LKAASGVFLNRIFYIVFVLILCAPSFFRLPGVQDFLAGRAPAESDPWLARVENILQFPAAFEKFYNGYFPFRDRLIQLDYDIRLNLLHEVVFTNVLVGKQGWLYLTDEDNLDYYQNASPFSQGQLAHIQQKLDQVRGDMAAQGIDFVVVVSPNKETIYPEYLPDAIRQINQKSQMDQLVDYMDQNGQTRIIDLRKTLIDAKKSGQVYNRTDTHWNEPGAYLAYREIINSLSDRFPALKAYSPKDFTLSQETLRGDLSHMLPLTSPFIEQSISVTPKVPRKAQMLQYDPNGTTITETADVGLPKAVIFRDSFFNSLLPFFSEHFRRAVYVHSFEVDEDLVMKEKPDVVILEIAERYLNQWTR
jgi:alginate O-acetyltransferase complex protein AlgJ